MEGTEYGPSTAWTIFSKERSCARLKKGTEHRSSSCPLVDNKNCPWPDEAISISVPYYVWPMGHMSRAELWMEVI